MLEDLGGHGLEHAKRVPISDFERLEGRLFGDEDWRMDWWVRQSRKRLSLIADQAPRPEPPPPAA